AQDLVGDLLGVWWRVIRRRLNGAHALGGNRGVLLDDFRVIGAHTAGDGGRGEGAGLQDHDVYVEGFERVVQAFGQAFGGPLARGVEAAGVGQDATEGAGDVDQQAGSALPHTRQHRFVDAHGPEDVDLEQSAHLVHVEGLDRATGSDAGVVDD